MLRNFGGLVQHMLTELEFGLQRILLPLEAESASVSSKWPWLHYRLSRATTHKGCFQEVREGKMEYMPYPQLVEQVVLLLYHLVHH